MLVGYKILHLILYALRYQAEDVPFRQYLVTEVDVDGYAPERFLAEIIEKSLVQPAPVFPVEPSQSGSNGRWAGNVC